MTVEELHDLMVAANLECVRFLKNESGPPVSYSERRNRFSKLISDHHFARDTFEIARGHGVPAAMMFKLSDGNLDPRHPTP